MAFLWLLHIKLALIAQQGVKMLFSQQNFWLIVFVVKICELKKKRFSERTHLVSGVSFNFYNITKLEAPTISLLCVEK